MSFRFLSVYFSLMSACCLCNDLAKSGHQSKLSSPYHLDQDVLCKITDDTDKYFKGVPVAIRSKFVIPKTIVRSQTVSVDVVGKPNDHFLFRACQLRAPPNGKSGEKCKPLSVIYGSEKNTSYNHTSPDRRRLSLNVSHHLDCNLCVLQLAYRKVNKTSGELNYGTDTKSDFITCGVFAVGTGRRKRQAETCQGAGDFITLPGIDWWCRENCAVGYCPSTHCTCANQAYPADDDYEYNDDTLRVEFLK